MTPRVGSLFSGTGAMDLAVCMGPGTRSGLWTHAAHAIDVLRPRLVVIENVRVTAVPGLSRNEQLKLLGNGVVPQQCAAAIRGLLDTGPNRPVQVEDRDSVRT